MPVSAVHRVELPQIRKRAVLAHLAHLRLRSFFIGVLQLHPPRWFRVIKQRHEHTSPPDNSPAKPLVHAAIAGNGNRETGTERLLIGFRLQALTMRRRSVGSVPQIGTVCLAGLGRTWLRREADTDFAPSLPSPRPSVRSLRDCGAVAFNDIPAFMASKQREPIVDEFF